MPAIFFFPILQRPTDPALQQQVLSYAAIDLITGAMKLIQQIDSIDSLEAPDAALGFTVLNELIDEWSNQDYLIPTSIRSQYPLVAGKSAYTIGPGADFSQLRPMEIVAASVVPNRTAATPIERPIQPPLTIRQWQRVPMKSATALYPDRIYYDKREIGGWGTVFVYPVPTTSLADLILEWGAMLVEFFDLSTKYPLFPGYARALRYNLAIELAPHYNHDPSDIVLKRAVQAMASIKRKRIRPQVADFDRALAGGGGGGYNIRTDS